MFLVFIKTMASFDEVLGHMLARTDDPNVKKVLSAFDVEKSKNQNANIIASSRFLIKNHIDPTVDFLLQYTSDHYPHASPIIEDTMNSGKQKSDKVADIIQVLYAISPSQCRACKTTYISTSPENSDATLTCLLCGRRSHAECYKDYTVDEAVGIVFLCDPCLSTTETAALEEKNDANKDDKTPNDDRDKTPNDKVKDDDKKKEDPAPKHDDEICPLYKEHSCPHGLTGKREIEGKPCSLKHPPKCFYHIGKYGSNGCRYSAKRCPYYHPVLCENSLQIKLCLNKECKKYHLKGTNRKMTKESSREEKGSPSVQNTNPVQPRQQQQIRKPETTSVWEETRLRKNQNQSPKLDKIPESPDTKSNEENINALFLGCIQQLNANILQMKRDMTQNIKEIVQTTLTEKAYLQQNLQPNPCNIPLTFLRPQTSLTPSEIASLQRSTPSQNVQSQQVIPVGSLQQTSQ